MLQTIDPLTFPGYDELVIDMGGSFFHSSHWAKALCESYSYKPVCFASLKDRVLIPFMEVNSYLTGKRGVSLPFTDYCQPGIPDGADHMEIMDNVIQFGKSSHWKYIELRSGSSLPTECRPSTSFYGHDLKLNRTEEELFHGLRDSTKRNVKKAAKEGTRVSMGASASSLKRFYRLNCITRRDHGLPPQPYNFFEKIHEHVISKGLGYVALASCEAKDVAGAVFFSFGDRAFYKYGASDRRYQHLRANNLVMWEAIRWYRLNHVSLCFGRTEPENHGLLQFKRGWGAEEHNINYYKYDLRMNAFVEDAPKVYGLHNRIFRSFPMPALRVAGSFLYRHMG